MKGYKTQLLLTASFVFIFLPLISLAAVASTGSPCTPDIMPPYDDGKTVGDCPYLTENGSNLIHLKWDIQGNFKNPECQVNCLGGPSYNRTPCTGWPLGRRDNNNFINSSGTRQDLKPKDDVYIRSIVPGVSFFVSCQEKTTGTSNQVTAKGVKTAIKTSDVEIVAKRSIETFVTADEPCEIPFNPDPVSVIRNYGTIHITEKDAASWAIDDLDDMAGVGCNSVAPAFPGSGSRPDVEEIISCNQSCSAGWTGYYWNDIELNVLAKLKTDIFAGKPQALRICGNMHNHPEYPVASTTCHAVIAYGVMEGSQFVAGDKRVLIEVIDPNISQNGDHKGTLDCEKIPSLGASPWELICHNFSFGTAYMDPYKVSIYSFNGRDSLADNLQTQHDSFCSRSTLNAQLNVCKGTARERLLNNGILALDNPLTEEGKGSCHSWVILNMYLAYQGDFVGYDYHPGDGKTVNKDCDLNHYPLPAKKAGTNGGGNWLASLWLSWQGLFK